MRRRWSGRARPARAGDPERARRGRRFDESGGRGSLGFAGVVVKYARFEEVPVWKDAARFMVDVCSLTDHSLVRRKGDVANQLERAALSISSTIAEGFELGTTDQLIRFLYIAKGSAGECRSVLQGAARPPRAE
ncbi:MAG: four helix bundle protein [Planctomycetota bacterium]|nr:four helix bundle protein [Planctomycetota bacterium]